MSRRCFWELEMVVGRAVKGAVFQLMDDNTNAHKCVSLSEINELHAKASARAHSNTRPTYRDAHATQRHVLPTDGHSVTHIPTYAQKPLHLQTHIWADALKCSSPDIHTLTPRT